MTNRVEGIGGAESDYTSEVVENHGSAATSAPKDNVPPFQGVISSEEKGKDTDLNQVAGNLNKLLDGSPIEGPLDLPVPPPPIEGPLDLPVPPPPIRGILKVAQTVFPNMDPSVENADGAIRSKLFQLWRLVTLKLPHVLGKELTRFVVYSGVIQIAELDADLIAKLSPQHFDRVLDDQFAKLQSRHIAAMDANQRASLATKLPLLNREAAKELITLEPEASANAINQMDIKEAKIIFDRLPYLLGPNMDPKNPIDPLFSSTLERKIEIRELQIKEHPKHVVPAPEDFFVAAFADSEANRPYSETGKYEDVILAFPLGRDAQNWKITVNGKKPAENIQEQMDPIKPEDPSTKGNEVLCLIYENSGDLEKYAKEGESVEAVRKALTEGIQFFVHQGLVQPTLEQALMTYGTDIDRPTKIVLNPVPNEEENKGTHADILIDSKNDLVKIRIEAPLSIELISQEEGSSDTTVKHIGFAIQTVSMQIPISELLEKKVVTGSAQFVHSVQEVLGPHKNLIIDPTVEERDAQLTKIRESDRAVEMIGKLQAGEFSEHLVLELSNLRLVKGFGIKLGGVNSAIQKKLKEGLTIEACKKHFKDDPLHLEVLDAVEKMKDTNPDTEASVLLKEYIDLARDKVDQAVSVFEKENKLAKEDRGKFGQYKSHDIEEVMQIIESNLGEGNLTEESKIGLKEKVTQKLSELVSESNKTAESKKTLVDENQQQIDNFKARLTKELLEAYQQGETRISEEKINQIKKEFGIMTYDEKQIAMNRLIEQETNGITDIQEIKKIREEIYERISISDIFETCLENVTSEPHKLIAEIRGFAEIKPNLTTLEHISKKAKEGREERVDAIKAITSVEIEETIASQFEVALDTFFPLSLHFPDRTAKFAEMLLDEFLNNSYRPSTTV